MHTHCRRYFISDDTYFAESCIGKCSDGFVLGNRGQQCQSITIYQAAFLMNIKLDIAGISQELEMELHQGEDLVSRELLRKGVWEEYETQLLFL